MEQARAHSQQVGEAKRAEKQARREAKSQQPAEQDKEQSGENSGEFDGDEDDEEGGAESAVAAASAAARKPVIRQNNDAREESAQGDEEGGAESADASARQSGVRRNGGHRGESAQVRAAAKVSPSPRAWGTGSANDDCSGCGNEPRIPRLTCQKQCGRGYCGDGCFSHRGKNPATSCQCTGGMAHGGIASLNQPQRATVKGKSRSSALGASGHGSSGAAAAGAAGLKKKARG